MAIKFLNTVAVDTDVLYVDAASNEVGIGTTSPGSKLEVVEARSGSSASDQTKYTLVSRSTISSGTPGTGGIKVVYDDGSNEHAFGLVAGSTSADFLTSGPMHWYTNSDLNTNNATGFAMTIDTSQRVGIGDTDPGAKLVVAQPQITSGGFSTPFIELKSTAQTNNTGLVAMSFSTSTADNYGYSIGALRGSSGGASSFVISHHDNSLTGTERMRIDSGGNVGINVTDFSTTFGVVPDLRVGSRSGVNNPGVIDILRKDGAVVAGDIAGVFQFSVDDDNNYAVAQIETESAATSGSGNSGGGILKFKTTSATTGGTPTEHMRITEDGKVGIKTDDPTTDLHIAGSALITSNATVRGDLIIDKNPSSYPTAKLQFLRNGNLTPAMGEIIMNDNPGHEGMYIYARKTASPNTVSYIELPSSTNYDFEINLLGSSAVTIDSSTRNVGIGTTLPRTKLDINGPLAVIGGTFTSGTSGADSSSSSGIVLRRGKKIFSGVPNGSNEDFYLRTLIEHNSSGHIEIGQLGTSLIGDIILNTGSSGNLIFKTIGSESMRINSSGNVGIGTTSPDTKLHIEGNLLVDAYNVGEDNGIFLREGFLTTDQPSITVWDMSNSGASPDGLSLNAQDGIRFRENGGEVARFKDGFFGINKTSPATMLHVEGDTTLDRKTQLRLPSFSMGSSSITDEYLVIARKHDGSSTKINATGIQGTITFGRGSTSSGNKSAVYKLNVQSAYNSDLVEEFSYVGGTQVFTSLDVIDVGGTEYYALKVMTTGGGQIDNRCYAEGLLLTDGDSNIFSKVRVSDSNVSVVTSGVLLPLRYKTMSEGVARIQSPSGYVEIGPQNTSYSHFSTDRARFYFNKRIVVDEGIISTYNEKMQLQAPLGTTRMFLNNSNGNCSIGVEDSNARLTLKGTTGTGASNLLRIMSETAFSTTPGRMIEFFKSDGTSRGNIYMNAYGIGTSNSSDYRLKKNISLISGGIDRVKLLKPSRFSWIEGPDDYFQDGFIAHEVEQVVPEAISGEKDGVDSNGEPIYQGIDQVKIIPLLTAALKEAIAKIENLETRIQTLENN